MVALTPVEVAQLKRTRRTKRMQATKAQNQADGYTAEAEAITAALEAMGFETPNQEVPDAQ